jgi:hypothetical protein
MREISHNGSGNAGGASPPRRGGGATGCGCVGRRRATLGFWLGVLIGFLSVLAPLWATSDHDPAASSFSASTASSATATTKPSGGGAASNGNRISSNALSDEPSSSHEPVLKATLRRESLQDAPSCVHTFGQLELVNTVRTRITSPFVVVAPRGNKGAPLFTHSLTHSTNSRCPVSRPLPIRFRSTRPNRSSSTLSEPSTKRQFQPSRPRRLRNPIRNLQRG